MKLFQERCADIYVQISPYTHTRARARTHARTHALNSNKYL